MGKAFYLGGYASLVWLYWGVRCVPKEMNSWHKGEEGVLKMAAPRFLQNSGWSHLVVFPNLIFCYCCALHICSKNKVLTSFGTVLFQCSYQKQATSVLEIYFYPEKRLMVRAHLSYLSASVKLLCYELGKLHWLRDHFM